jgi:hypothetical protein
VSESPIPTGNVDGTAAQTIVGLDEERLKLPLQLQRLPDLFGVGLLRSKSVSRAYLVRIALIEILFM